VNVAGYLFTAEIFMVPITVTVSHKRPQLL